MKCFSDMAVKLLDSFSIFNPALLPSEEKKDFLSMEKKKLKSWLNYMEVRQQCPMMVSPILPILFLTRTTL